MNGQSNNNEHNKEHNKENKSNISKYIPRHKRVNQLSSLERSTRQINMLTNMDEFPSLDIGKQVNPITEVSSSSSTSSTWTLAIKQTVEADEEQHKLYINEADAKYWRGSNWIGPIIIRQKSLPDNWYTYMDNATSGSVHASSFIIPKTGQEYSRDGKHWYNSWNDTFSEEQLYNIRLEEEDEYQEECAIILKDYREDSMNESMRHYDETSELDGYGTAVLERLAYEEYVKYFEYIDDDILEEFDETSGNNSDYLEDDY